MDKYSGQAPVKTGFVSQLALPLTITVCVTLIMAFGSPLSDWLRFDRNAILNGEIWRIVTGHLAHLGWSHWLMNVSGLWLIWLIVGRLLGTRAWLAIILISATGISSGLLLFHPELFWYVGLSGVLHTLIISGCLADLRNKRTDTKLLLVIIIAKLIWEQVAGPLPGSEESAGGNVIVDAHLYGAILGGLLVLPFLARNITRKQHT